MLNKSKGNMYEFCSHTWNSIKGRCIHACKYCYYQANPRFQSTIGEIRLDEKCLKDNLGKGRTIFVGSSTDMFAEGIPSKWVMKTLEYCKKYPDNTYLFQSKNTKNMYIYEQFMPPKVIVGTTAETNRSTSKISKAPFPEERLAWLKQFVGIDRFISIEPIMDFDLKWFIHSLRTANPKFISIGADSKGNNLPEPPSEKVRELIYELQKFTQVKIKDNLKRLL